MIINVCLHFPIVLKDNIYLRYMSHDMHKASVLYIIELSRFFFIFDYINDESPGSQTL